GFAPPNGEALYRFLRSQGFSDNLIIRSALVKQSYNENKYYDFFRNRIIFPIRSLDGNVVSFGGREISGRDEPKYINLSETDLYKKSRILYGLWEGKDSIRDKKYAIRVEGYRDPLRCFQCGIKNVVATCGTALTIEQANIIRRFAPEVIIVYDADPAGISAALRATGVLLKAGLSVKAVVLPNSKDPDEFLLSHSIEEWHYLIEKAPTFFSFYIHQNKEKMKDPRGKINILGELFHLISTIEENSLKEEYLREISTELKISYWSVLSDYEQFLKNNFRVKQEAVSEEKKNISFDDACFIMGLISQPGLREQAKIFFEEYPLPEGIIGKVISYLLKEENTDPRLIEDPEVAGIVTKVLLSNFEPDNLSKVVEERLKKIRMDFLDNEINKIIGEIREAERVQNKEKLKTLLEKQKTLLHERNKLIS
ncbi:MAG: toprim domain-containing protein, partial [Candidatus Hydrogenedentes bacterium]|nr:toprim domain-containing protein [Candidatus Hydrogenedentota bacterium]